MLIVDKSAIVHLPSSITSRVFRDVGGNGKIESIYGILAAAVA